MATKQSTMKIEMTILCNSLHDASLIEDVVKGTASTYAIRTVNGSETKHDTPTGRTVVYAGGKKDKGISAKELAIKYAKEHGGRIDMEQLNRVAIAEYQFAPTSLQSKVDILVTDGVLRRGDRKGIYHLVVK
jgi:hypothetical protein